MNWEIDSEKTEKSVCACGKGFVLRTVVNESDDWHRYNSYVRDEKIKCSTCSENYHIEHRIMNNRDPSGKHDTVIDETYLVPDGNTLALQLEKKTLPYEQFACFENRVVAKHSKEEILDIIKDMQESRYSTRLMLAASHDVVNDFYQVYKSRKLDNIAPVLEECIENYDTYEWTRPKVLEYRKKEQQVIRQNHKDLQETLKHSFKLSFM